jgi:biopolymer transport protein ExbB
MIAAVQAWWAGGDLLMPVMLAVALALYALLAERSLALWGVRRARRAAELRAALAGGGAWAARLVAVAEDAALARGLTLARALAASLPLLGLLGTVTGMVDTFAGLAAGGGAAARAAGGGIGLALTATQYGMALAVPALLWLGLLEARARALAAHRDGLLLERQAGAAAVRELVPA